MTDVIAASAVAEAGGGLAGNGGRRGSCLWFKSCARQRWRILAKAIQLQKRSMLLNDAEPFGGDKEGPPPPPPQPVIDVMRNCEDSSVRRFGGFGLINCSPMNENQIINQSELFGELLNRLCGHSRNWYNYQIQLEGNDHEVFSLNVHHILEKAVSVSELMGFNNTGNICLWPSEEALAAYVLENKETFANKSVLELGGGMTCIAGLFIAKYCNPYLIHLTDGNAKSVENVQTIIRMNELGSKCFLKASVLKWESLGEHHRQYDYIMCADCLFFDETRDSLIAAIDSLLHAAGQALVMAPRRGNTFQRFIDGCLVRGFHVRVVEQYSLQVWKQLLELKATQGCDYNEDIHYPVLILLTKQPMGQVEKGGERSIWVQ